MVNGNMISVLFDGAVAQNEVGYAVVGAGGGGRRLMSEVVRIRGRRADMQVFEDTTGLAIGDTVEFSGDLLAAELGPGLLGQVYDGLQNPLPRLAEQCGFFLQSGTYLDPLPRDRKWAFTPAVKAGDKVRAGDTLGTVPEGIFKHRIMAPFGLEGAWTVASVAAAGDYTVAETVATLEGPGGAKRDVAMAQRWPVKVPMTCFEERLSPTETMSRSSAPSTPSSPSRSAGRSAPPGPSARARRCFSTPSAATPRPTW